MTRGYLNIQKVLLIMLMLKKFWDLCKFAYNKHGLVEDIPQNISEQKWICDYDTALWKLKFLIWWMQRERISISGNWNFCRKFVCGNFIKVKHPKLTLNQEIRCIIEGIKKDRDKVKIQMNLIFH